VSQTPVAGDVCTPVTECEYDQTSPRPVGSPSPAYSDTEFTAILTPVAGSPLVTPVACTQVTDSGYDHTSAASTCVDPRPVGSPSPAHRDTDSAAAAGAPPPCEDSDVQPEPCVGVGDRLLTHLRRRRVVVLSDSDSDELVQPAVRDAAPARKRGRPRKQPDPASAAAAGAAAPPVPCEKEYCCCYSTRRRRRGVVDDESEQDDDVSLESAHAMAPEEEEADVHAAHFFAAFHVPAAKPNALDTAVEEVAALLRDEPTVPLGFDPDVASCWPDTWCAWNGCTWTGNEAELEDHVNTHFCLGDMYPEVEVQEHTSSEELTEYQIYQRAIKLKCLRMSAPRSGIAFHRRALATFSTAKNAVSALVCFLCAQVSTDGKMVEIEEGGLVCGTTTKEFLSLSRYCENFVEPAYRGAVTAAMRRDGYTHQLADGTEIVCCTNDMCGSRAPLRVYRGEVILMCLLPSRCAKDVTVTPTRDSRCPPMRSRMGCISAQTSSATCR